MSGEERVGWVLRNWPIIIVTGCGIAWGVRLEERLGNHLQLAYHDGMRQQRDELIEIKAELRFLREDVQELKKSLENSRQ